MTRRYDPDIVDYLKKGHKMKLNSELSEQDSEKVATTLNAPLADEYILDTKTRNAYWNVDGNSLGELHDFLQSQYVAVDVIIDDVAERVHALSHLALGTLRDYLTVARLSEYNEHFENQDQIVGVLLEDHEFLIRLLRKNITAALQECSDLDTTDFMTGLMEQHEKMAWMLRRYLK